MMPHHKFPAIVFASLFGVLGSLLYDLFLQPRNVTWLTRLLFILGFEWVFSNFVYRLTCHPLAKYPGPLLAALTDWYTVYWIAQGDRHLDLDWQHTKHGKYVRFGPNRLSINSVAASRDLHSVNSNTSKADVYDSFRRFFGAEMSMTTTDQKTHAFRRQVNAAAITPSAISQFENLITPHIDDFVAILGQRAGGGALGKGANENGWGPGLNMSHAVAYCVADIMGSMTFGRSWNAQREPRYRRLVRDLPNGVAGMHLIGHMQSLFLFNLHKALFRKLNRAVRQLMDLSRSLALWRKEQTSTSHQDIWAALLASRDPKTGAGFSEDELISEASLFIVAGTDTVITATVSTLFYLLHNPHTLKKLGQEIRTAFPLPRASKDTLRASKGVCPIRFASKELQSIKYLTACIDEAMRLSPPVPSILPRVVGPGGMMVDEEFFPAGVNLGIPHYSMHRTEENFPEPLAYRPERWMGSSAVQGKGMPASAFTPFGAGRWSCIGKHLAYHEVSILLARIIWLFDLRLDPTNPLGRGGEAARGRGGRLHPGRHREDEFQLYDRFVSSQEGPVIQFRYREELAA